MIRISTHQTKNQLPARQRQCASDNFLTSRATRASAQVINFPGYRKKKYFFLGASVYLSWSRPAKPPQI
jgi:hypothetical protein